MAAQTLLVVTGIQLTTENNSNGIYGISIEIVVRLYQDYVVTGVADSGVLEVLGGIDRTQWNDGSVYG